MDGSTGEVLAVSADEARAVQEQAEQQRLLLEKTSGPGRTSDGESIKLLLNVGSAADLVGYLNYIHPYRVQIVGKREVEKGTVSVRLRTEENIGELTIDAFIERALGSRWMTSIGYTAFLAGPPVIGFLADRIGVLSALWVVVAVLATGLVTAAAAREPARA